MSLSPDNTGMMRMHQYSNPTCMHAATSEGFQSAFGAQSMGDAGFGQNQQIGFGAAGAQSSTQSSFGGALSEGFQNRSNNAYNGKSMVDRDQLWEEYKQQPTNFWDNRAKKLNPKAPDFKHKVSGEGLWVSSSPAWFNVDEHPPYRTLQHFSLRTLCRKFAMQTLEVRCVQVAECFHFGTPCIYCLIASTDRHDVRQNSPYESSDVAADYSFQTPLTSHSLIYFLAAAG